jgi:hypothetical protein
MVRKSPFASAVTRTITSGGRRFLGCQLRSQFAAIGPSHRELHALDLFVGKPIVVRVVDMVDDHEERLGRKVLRLRRQIAHFRVGFL